MFLLCRQSAGQLSVPLGFVVITQFVVDPSPKLVGFRVVAWEQFDVSFEVGERFFPVRVGQLGQCNRAVPVAHVVVWVELDCAGGILDRKVRLWRRRDRVSVGAATLVRRIIGLQVGGLCVIVDGLLVVAELLAVALDYEDGVTLGGCCILDGSA